MPVTTFDQFSAGLDLRKGIAVSDANRLLKLDNAHVTTGMAITKRLGLARHAALAPGTKGLFSAFGKLHTFYGSGNISHTGTNIVANKVAQNADGSSNAIRKVDFADVFMGFIYASITYTSGTRRHHYINGRANTLVTDANCPSTQIVLKASSKIFAPTTSGDALKMSAGANALDWSSVNDAASLGTGMYSRGSRQITGLGQYKNELVVFMRDGVQSWITDPDPRKFSLRTTLENVGTNYPNSISNVGLDLYFLSDYGFRSITTMQYTNNLSDADIGSPVDSLVRPLVRNLAKFPSIDPLMVPNSIFFYGTGQYICTFITEAFVYTTSKTSGVAAWSRYMFRLPNSGPADGMAELDQELYLRFGDAVYKLSEDVHTDDGGPFEVLIQMPYVNFKKPSSLKRLYGIDLVTTGTCFVSIGWDSNNSLAFTPEIEVTGNTRPGDLIPVECTGTEFSIRIRNFDDKPFRFDAVSLHWDDLGVI